MTGRGQTPYESMYSALHLVQPYLEKYGCVGNSLRDAPWTDAGLTYTALTDTGLTDTGLTDARLTDWHRADWYTGWFPFVRFESPDTLIVLAGQSLSACIWEREAELFLPAVKRISGHPGGFC